MIQHKPILADAEMHALISGNPFALGLSIARLKDFIRQIEKAVVAKLHEQQEPAAWKRGKAIFESKEVAERAYLSPDLMLEPLYAHPCVSPVSNKPVCASEKEECETQDHFVDVRKMVLGDHIPDAKNRVNLSLSIDAKEAQTLLRSYLCNLDDWQLMPKKLTGEMLRSAISFIENAPDCMWIEYIGSLYDTLLAAAPKLMEGDK